LPGGVSSPASNACSGFKTQRTGVVFPAAFVKRNVFSPWKVVLPNPDERGSVVIFLKTSTVSG
jgi:hypothetical protein